jgi:dienelactone hydrolase
MEPVDYLIGGKSYSGWLANGARKGERVPGVVVAHEGPGLTAHTKQRAEMVAGLGYVAFAADLFGEPEPPMERARELNKMLRENVPELRARMAGALAVLQRHEDVDSERLAAIGYCFGGAAAVELARSGAPLKAVAGFHAGILPGPAEDDRAIRGKVLLCHGADDPAVPPEQIQAFTAALSAAEVDWQFHLYGGVGHSFTNPDIDAYGLPGFAYDERADRRSWAAMRNLFEETLGS